MPLLKRKAFEKSKASEYLRDDDEVFHCEITDEIFKDYEEYCERIILVNSMVWTCEMTGKNNLTYSEALQSEKAARRALKDFPMELRIPILFLAMQTKRCSFAEMTEDVFNFVRDRYFVGETVEACLEGDQWSEAHILSVTAQKQHPDSKALLPASSYCYEVEQYDEENPTSTGQIGTAPFDRLRRRKGVYTRDKNRLFLKQFVENGGEGVIVIKKSAQEKYSISKVSFDQIFTGIPPVFPSSKKLLKSPPAGKSQAKPGSASKLNKSLKKTSPTKGRQESMDKFVKKTDKAEAQKFKPPADPAAKKSAQELAEKMRRAEDQMRQRKEEERAKKKEKTARLQAYMKEWQKVKDDTELEDQKMIPKGTPIDVEGIPHQHFGDFLSVLEFVHIYSEILKVKDVFHNQLDLETFRKALTQKEHAGVFSDLIQMFLTTIFSLQEDEAEEYNENGGIQLSTEDQHIDSDMGVTKAMELATKASKWSQTYLGTPLSKLPLDPTTVSEVLRLHLLSSGAGPGARCASWRYQARGGYTSADDAGLRLRVTQPRLLRALARAHVADLPLEDKFLVLQCLMNQILSYATVRDVIEEKLEEMKNTKQALRLLQTNERKREVQVQAAKQELKKEAAAKKEENKLSGEKARAVDEETKAAIEKLTADSEEKRKEYEKKLQELQTELFEYMSYVGSDRAFHRYWVMRSLGGLFVEAGAEPRGVCGKPLLPAGDTDTLQHVQALFEQQKERAGSDKENESGSNSRGNSPKKPLANLNGLSQKLNGLESNTQQLRDLLMCTGDAATCLVHGKSERPRWWVYHSGAALDALAGALNPRGLREAELRAALLGERARLLPHLDRCPVHLLNPAAAPAPAVPTHYTRLRKPQLSLAVPADCSLAEALELSLRDHILELEEKIFHGCLGALKVKDREAWRGTLMLRGYDKQAEFLTWGPRQQYRDDYHLPDGELHVPDDMEEEERQSIALNKYRDPGHYLEAPRNGLNGPGPASAAAPAPAPSGPTVRALASALLQVSRAIHHKYLRRPLGLDDKERKDREARNKPLDLEALERWEVSLMECKSLSQLVLHLFTLDSSITWSASILNASCRLCRRKTDPDNMLLCDGCNKGHHLYCLKPKLTKVPEGDWFCDQCKPKERTPRKRRKLFSDDDIEEELDSSAADADVDAGVCGGCGSGGRLAAGCGGCGARYHAECAEPRPARAARRWLCAACRKPHRDSDDSEDNTALVKLKSRRSRASKESSPVHNGGAKRGRKSKSNEEINTSGHSGRRSKNSLTNGVHEDRPARESSRKRGRRASPALHADLMQQLLRDVMKHKDCWPFYEPVSLEDVPDYLSVIEQPMDFSTIRNKLEAGEYDTDDDLLGDAALVFLNCYTYNKDSHPVAKAGNRLEKYMNKRCLELELPQLPGIEVEDEEQGQEAARKRPAAPAEGPHSKRARLC
ncbi:bromodomain adjacent to zinc finger domain protein 1A-like [Trichoplusia ni]|uniref:Bromodomain adjacent to zinc finger domain protein 1A n=1 Tax=Trichoplusia ni TaxID=7111 RepID=A0A7E5WQD0_TRINI|nr:bromodomain adjacent to zinc finger domain protein 1A-like [Trichoplusia ni]